MSDMPCFIGIDVAKAQLDIAVRPSGERWAVANDASGVATLVERVQPISANLPLFPRAPRLLHAAFCCLSGHAQARWPSQVRTVDS